MLLEDGGFEVGDLLLGRCKLRLALRQSVLGVLELVADLRQRGHGHVVLGLCRVKGGEGGIRCLGGIGVVRRDAKNGQTEQRQRSAFQNGAAPKALGGHCGNAARL